MKKLKVLMAGAMLLSASLVYGQEVLLQKQKRSTTSDQTVLETFRPQNRLIVLDERERGTDPTCSIRI